MIFYYRCTYSVLLLLGCFLLYFTYLGMYISDVAFNSRVVSLNSTAWSINGVIYDHNPVRSLDLDYTLFTISTFMIIASYVMLYFDKTY